MNTSSEIERGPIDFLQKLTSLDHRGVGSKEVDQASGMIKEWLIQKGANVEIQSFQTPKTYLPIVWLLVAGVIAGLFLSGIFPWLAFFISLLFTVLSIQYFDWRPTPVQHIVPKVKAENIIGRFPQEQKTGQKKKKLILMAHYDTAPISILYLPSMVGNFRQSLLTSLGIMLVTPFLVLMNALGIQHVILTWLIYGLGVYFIVQGVISGFDYLRLGFSNGAADNATGTVVAMETALKLWKDPMPGWDVEVVLTSAEEANMIGARHYYIKNKKELLENETFVLNFDNLGAGNIKIVTQTGSITMVRYDNPLVDAAVKTAGEEDRFKEITTGHWHTGDFDSIWFERGGIPSLTISAQDEMGRIPNLHRPGDTIENVDMSLPPKAVDFAEATARNLAIFFS
jgi:acetylornithine deacetylase/succinyl-diaminopimelate desuccinylase-like protein